MRSVAFDGVWQDEQITVKLRAGENTLALGPPFKLKVSAAACGTGPHMVKVKNVVLVGAGGELYDAPTRGVRSSVYCSIASGTKQRCPGRLEYG